jgi:hypothetical protein
MSPDPSSAFEKLEKAVQRLSRHLSELEEAERGNEAEQSGANQNGSS